jgi:hypothetical protein
MVGHQSPSQELSFGVGQVLLQQREIGAAIRGTEEDPFAVRLPLG